MKCAANCKGNSDEQTKVKVYRLPRPRDPPSVFTCIKPSQVSTLPPQKRSTVKALAELRNLLYLMRATIFLEKEKIKDFRIFRNISVLMV